jgi:predicted ArsR family transcriptional regulator
MTSIPLLPPNQASVTLDRDVFLRSLVRELAGTLEDVVGLNEASGFISVVGQRIGEWIDSEYRQALGTAQLNQAQVTEVLVDLKRRIQGDFYLIESDEHHIVLGNRACPFADKVLGRPSMCMMTSNVFGTIAAQNLGRSKVVLQQTIASGSPTCRVVIYLKPSAEADAADGREYFRV